MSDAAEADGRSQRLKIAAAAGCIVVATVIAYSNSFDGKYLFDDTAAIIENVTLRDVTALDQVFSPPGRTSVSHRPLANLSLALNYAMHGLRPWGYHATNLLIHLIAALALFGIVRRTLLSEALRQRFGQAATPLAMGTALVWALHPLQTESVTYIIQRVESQMGMFFLLSAYCAIRWIEHHGWVWITAATAAAWMATGTKEVAVTLPVALLLWDRYFASGGFRPAIRQHWPMYLCVLSSWAVLLERMETAARITTYQGNPSVSRQVINPGYASTFDYISTQFQVHVHYLRLAIWPDDLVLDYRWPWARDPAQIIPYALVIGLIVVLTLWGLWRRKLWAFAVAVYFLILAPTSSILRLPDAAVEHRLYLSLSGFAALLVIGGYALIKRLERWAADHPQHGASMQRWIVAAPVLAMVLLTRVTPGASYWFTVLPAVAVFGLGLSAVVAPVTATVLAAAEDRHAGVASGVNNAVARTARLLAVAVLPAAAGLSGSAYTDPAALTEGWQTAMWLCAGLCVVGAVLAVWIRNDILEAPVPEGICESPHPGDCMHGGVEGPPTHVEPRRHREAVA